MRVTTATYFVTAVDVSYDICRKQLDRRTFLGAGDRFVCWSPRQGCHCHRWSPPPQCLNLNVNLNNMLRFFQVEVECTPTLEGLLLAPGAAVSCRSRLGYATTQVRV